MKYFVLPALSIIALMLIFQSCRPDKSDIGSGYYFKFKRNGAWESFTKNMGGGEISSTHILVIGATAADSSEYINFTFRKTGASGTTPDSTGNITPAYIPEGNWYIRLKNGNFITDDKLSSEFNNTKLSVTDAYIKGSFSGTLTYIYPVGKKNTITDVEFYLERRF